MSVSKEKHGSAHAAFAEHPGWHGHFVGLGLILLLGISLTGCGRKGSPPEGNVGSDAGGTGADAGPQDGGVGPDVQINRVPGTLQGSPSLAIVVPKLDAGPVVTPPVDGGGPVSE